MTTDEILMAVSSVHRRLTYSNPISMGDLEDKHSDLTMLTMMRDYLRAGDGEGFATYCQTKFLNGTSKARMSRLLDMVFNVLGIKKWDEMTPITAE